MACMLASFSEGLTLADRAGLDRSDLIKILELGAMNNPMFNIKGPKIVADGVWACDRRRCCCRRRPVAFPAHHGTAPHYTKPPTQSIRPTSP